MKKFQLLSLTGERKGVSRQPLVELYGLSRALIENHQGVLVYAPTEIKVRVCYGCVMLRGEALVLTEMNKDQLVICGKIQELQLVRG